jgi:hypothetical protein
MKVTFTLVAVLLTSIAFAQVDTIPDPPGYNHLQLKDKNILRVAPDDHIWIGFATIGAGEYDGTTWRMYNDTNGLPTNKVTAFAFQNTIKWIGTENGLVKTDGVNILSFNTSNSPMPSNRINYLYQADTALWIATDSGAVSFDGTFWNIYNKTNSPLTSDTILSIGENSFGIYISDKNTVKIKTSTGWANTYPVIPPVKRFVSDSNGKLYTSSYIVDDTVFKPLFIPSDPCRFDDNLSFDPMYILGESNHSSLYVVNNRPTYESILFDISYSFNLQDASQLIISAPEIVSCLQEIGNNEQNFDFNSSHELITTSSSLSFNKIVKTDFSALIPFTSPDSCPYLDINEVRARVWNQGTMFWDLIGNPLYEVPKYSGKSALFAEGFWIGGKDPAGNLHQAAQTYRQSGADFWPGPLDTTNAITDPITTTEYDKLWKIDKFTILTFIEKFLDGSVTNGTYPIPDIILNWPAHGSGNNARSLAPFVDINGDGNYDPHTGDYPKIKGDQMIWWVFNDNAGPHGETQSPLNLGVEIHGSAYAYGCPSLSNGDSVINYTTFYHYDIFNRSDTNYHDVYVAKYTDVDLGNYLDDYVGCDTLLDFAFAYNGDDDDWGSMGYGIHPPMINLLCLKGPQPDPSDGIDNNHNGTIDEIGEVCMMNNFIYYNNDGSNTGNPSNATHYYNRSQSVWKDGTHVTFGGIGYNPGSTDYTNYMFSGDPYDSTAWSERFPCLGCQPNEPSDRRFLTSSGPFDLPAHQMRSIDYAYVYTREPNAPNGPTTSFAVNRDQVQRIKNFFETDSFPCNHAISVPELIENSALILFPNPAHSEINVSIPGGERGIIKYKISDLLGQEIISPTETTGSFKVSTEHFSPGVYFIEVYTKQYIYSKKFIIQ